MPGILNAVHQKVRNFVRNSPAFKRVCEQTFDALDYRSCGKVTVNQAASCVESLFRELQGACDEYGIVLDPLTSDDVYQIFQECDYNDSATLDQDEFRQFYASIVTYAAMKACTGFGRKYGMGMALGIAGTFLLKNIIRRVPVVGLVSRPFLALMPTILVGPLLGVAVVYGLEKGDLLAIRRKFLGAPKREKAPRIALATT